MRNAPDLVELGKDARAKTASRPAPLIEAEQRLHAPPNSWQNGNAMS